MQLKVPVAAVEMSGGGLGQIRRPSIRTIPDVRFRVVDEQRMAVWTQGHTTLPLDDKLHREQAGAGATANDPVR